MASIFTKIRNKEIPGTIFADVGEFFVIHDKIPTQLGHLLVIPSREVGYIFDLDQASYLNLWQYTSQVASKLEAITGAKRIGIKVEGLEVPHIHIHLIPIWQAGDMDKTTPVSLDEIQALQRKFSQD